LTALDKELTLLPRKFVTPLKKVLDVCLTDDHVSSLIILLVLSNAVEAARPVTEAADDKNDPTWSPALPQKST
jgi:hypothetical protein